MSDPSRPSGKGLYELVIEMNHTIYKLPFLTSLRI